MIIWCGRNIVYVKLRVFISLCSQLSSDQLFVTVFPSLADCRYLSDSCSSSSHARIKSIFEESTPYTRWSILDFQGQAQDQLAMYICPRIFEANCICYRGVRTAWQKDLIDWLIYAVNRLTPTVAIWYKASCQSDRVKPSFVIFDIRAFWHSALSVRVPGCQKLQMTA